MAANLSGLFAQFNPQLEKREPLLQRSTEDNPGGIAKALAGLLGGELKSKKEKMKDITDAVDPSDPKSVLAASKAMEEHDTARSAQLLTRYDNLIKTAKTDTKAGEQGRAFTVYLEGKGFDTAVAEQLSKLEPSAALKIISAMSAEEIAEANNESRTAIATAGNVSAEGIADNRNITQLEATDASVAGQLAVQKSREVAAASEGGLDRTAAQERAETNANAIRPQAAPMGKLPTAATMGLVSAFVDEMDQGDGGFPLVGSEFSDTDIMDVAGQVEVAIRDNTFSSPREATAAFVQDLRLRRAQGADSPKRNNATQKRNAVLGGFKTAEGNVITPQQLAQLEQISLETVENHNMFIQKFGYDPQDIANGK